MKEGLQRLRPRRRLRRGRGGPGARAGAREDRARGDGRRDAARCPTWRCTGTRALGDEREARPILAWVRTARRTGGPGRARRRCAPSSSARSRTKLDLRPGQGRARREALPRQAALGRRHALLRVLPRPRPGRHRPAGRSRTASAARRAASTRPRPSTPRSTSCSSGTAAPRRSRRRPAARRINPVEMGSAGWTQIVGEAEQGQGAAQGVRGRLPRGLQREDDHAARSPSSSARSLTPNSRFDKYLTGDAAALDRGREARLRGVRREGLRDLPRGRAARREVLRGDGPPRRLLQGARRRRSPTPTTAATT